MRFQPKSEAEVEKEASKFSPWKPGFYDFEIADGADDTSKNGNEMIKLTIHVFNQDGQRRTLFDYLLDSMPHKLRHAAYACGLSGPYEAGNLMGADFFGKTGRLKLGIEPEKDGYPSKNKILDYIVEKSAGGGMGAPSQTKPSIDLDDAIPFEACWQ